MHQHHNRSRNLPEQQPRQIDMLHHHRSLVLYLSRRHSEMHHKPFHLYHRRPKLAKYPRQLL
jgi:hypothetical protein